MGLSEIGSEAAAAARRARHRLIIAVAAGFFCLVAFGFAVAAGVIAMTAEVGALGACLVTAGFFAFVALLVVVLGRSQQPPEPSARPAPKFSDDDAFTHLVTTFVAGVRAAKGGTRDKD